MPVIQIVAFRGAGGLFNEDHTHYKEPGLIRAGHVGLQGVIAGQIIGFSPTPEAAEKLGGEAKLLEALGQYLAQSGRLQDDTAIFRRAHELADKTNGRTTVWEMDVEISEETLQLIREWYNSKRTALYNLPRQTPPQFSENEYQYCRQLCGKIVNRASSDTAKLS